MRKGVFVTVKTADDKGLVLETGVKLTPLAAVKCLRLAHAITVASSQGLRQRPWAMGPAMGWGLGLALLGIAVFALGAGGSLREGMVRRERERLQRQQQDR